MVFRRVSVGKSIVGKARCLFFDAGMDKRFWVEAANKDVYLENKTMVNLRLKYGQEHKPFESF